MNRRIGEINGGVVGIRALARCGLFLVAVSVACGTTNDNGNRNGNNGGTTADLAAWVVNTTERSTQIFESDSNLGVLHDVQVAEARTVDSVDYIYVETSGIPKYDVLVTEELVDSLNARPRAATDFVTGVTTASAGQTVAFGEDIGFDSSNQNCDDTGGQGYWPPGPVCPTDLGRAEFFPATPEPTDEACETGLGTVGLMVNGASIFNWGDGMSFGNGVWFNLAPIAEQYDIDICAGHAANGEYHHHGYTTCLANLVGDEGTGHSPIYGFAADGYPLYGPYEGAGTLAVSGWVERDYGASIANGGCGTPGARTCILVDEYDITQGVDSSVNPGPDIGASVTTASGNSLSATSGYYYEDYYYGGAEVTGAQLDEHNGHDHGDERGYHYHVTLVEDDDDELVPDFPFMIGPRFRGELPENAVTGCGGGGGGGGGPPGGMPPGPPSP
ncbi:MAG: YHYH protein [Myxococcota bacterium]